MFDNLIFNKKQYAFTDKNLKLFYDCMLRNDSIDDYDNKYVLSFLSNSIVRKKYEDLDYHEFILECDFRISKLVCNIANVFGEEKANMYGLRLAEDLSADSSDIQTNYFYSISTAEASSIWKELFGPAEDFEKFKSLLALLMLYEMAEFDYEQQCEDIKGLKKVTFLNGMGIAEKEYGEKVILKPLFEQYDTSFEDYVEIAGVSIPLTLLSVMFKTELNVSTIRAIDKSILEKKFLFKYKQLSGKELKIEIDKEDYSKWENDNRLYGVWYSIYKTDHPVLGTYYNLNVNSYNEDGTLFKYVQLGLKDLSFSPNIRWSNHVEKWKTKDGEIMLLNDSLDKRSRFKYEFTNGVLLLCNAKYYRSLQAAIETLE